jgi:hypothetical protein
MTARLITLTEAECRIADRAAGLSYRRVADIAAVPVRWLWPGRVARGKVSMLAGHPGLGKSQLTAAIAAIVTTGGRWPVDGSKAERGNVVFLSAEDDPADTIRPRLEAVGADLSRTYILDSTVIEDGSNHRALDLGADLARLGQTLDDIGDVALVVIDPITAYLGEADSHKNAEVRALLAPLSDMAAKHGTAIVAVSHMNKAGGGEALMRVTGSLAFVAAARAAFIVTRDSESDGRRLLLPVKNNLGDDRTGYAFTVEKAEVASAAGRIETSRVVWESDSVTVTADEALTSMGDPEDRSALAEAREFLADALREGPVPVRQIEGDARAAGISSRTLRRARDALGVIRAKAGMRAGWTLALPAGTPKVAKPAEDGQAKDMDAFGDFGRLRNEPIDSNQEVDVEL